MLVKILDSFEESYRLKLLSKFHEHWQTFEEAVNELTEKFQNEMKILYREKKHAILYCSKVMRDSELDAEQRSIDLIK
jgi:hypothetical protein